MPNKNLAKLYNDELNVWKDKMLKVIQKDYPNVKSLSELEMDIEYDFLQGVSFEEMAGKWILAKEWEQSGEMEKCS